MSSLIKICSFSFVILLWAVFSPSVVEAQNLAGAAQCTGSTCSACNLIFLANAIIKWLIGFLCVLFAVLMAVAGWGLVVSGGNQSALEAAKSKFTNAIIGFLIVLSAWLVVDTIMRGLVQPGGVIDGDASGALFWSRVECQTQTRLSDTNANPINLGDVYFDHIDYPSLPTWYGDPALNPTGAGPTGPAPVGCTGGDCVALSTPCKNQNSCSISPDLVDRINAFHVAAGVSGARVTEAMPPTRAHKSPCHSNGTCIDYSKAGGMTAAEVNRVIQAARANGLRPVYEVQSQSQKNSLVSGGVPADSIAVLGSWISAPHFSIYGQ